MTTSTANTRVSIRLATAADRDFILTLAARLADFDRPAHRSAREIAEGDRSALAGALDTPDDESPLFVAELDGARAGCLLMWTLTDYFTREQHAHVSVLAVARDAEGHGVGTTLLQHAERWARDRGHGRITLNVFDRNARARALYARTGYEAEVVKMIKIL
jgi:GNAT superfamily N-acetyltransferase